MILHWKLKRNLSSMWNLKSRDLLKIIEILDEFYTNEKLSINAQPPSHNKFRILF